MHSVTITGITMTSGRTAKPNKGGSRILAFFDCTVNGLALRSCAFVRTGRGGMTVWPPKMDEADGRRCVLIEDDSLRAHMLREARAAYIMLGGTDAEWKEEPTVSDAVINASFGPG